MCVCIKATRKATSNVLTHVVHMLILQYLQGSSEPLSLLQKQKIKHRSTTDQIHESKAAECLKNKLNNI